MEPQESPFVHNTCGTRNNNFTVDARVTLVWRDGRWVVDNDSEIDVQNHIGHFCLTCETEEGEWDFRPQDDVPVDNEDRYDLYIKEN